MSPGARAGAAAAVLLACAAARADDPTERGFDADPVRWGLGLERAFAVESGLPGQPGTLAAEVLVGHAVGLLSLTVGDERSRLLESRGYADLMATYAFRRFEIGAHLPIAFAQEADFSLLLDQGVPPDSALVAPVASTALGDLRVLGKVPFLDAKRFPVAAAALLDVRLPTGDGDAFRSDGFALIPSVAASRAFGKLRLDAQLGYHLRGAGQYAQLVVHDGLVYGLAGSLDLPAAWRIARWRAIAELTGGWPRGASGDEERYRAPLSARAGVRAAVWRDLAVELGAGAGLGAEGYGREAWRVFLGVRWERFRPDRDGDGTWDGADPCPDVAGPKEHAGCPVVDLDRDGVPNKDDLCPSEPGAADLDGCPDRDSDTIPDREDRCPKEAGPAQNEGCPVAEEEPVVEIETERLSLRDAINFDTGKDTIKRESHRVLDEIASILKAHSEIGRVRVEGHTDNVGSASYNKDLSQRRANSVVEYLASRGVARERLAPVGFGFERPVASNATALGRAKNRRVEFTILSGDSAR
jgi:outer membrane protein OmpA-like peptidoglycan-associated protein